MERLISFFEIPAVDFDRAVRFYEQVLGVRLPVMSCEEEKMAFFPQEEGRPPGAVSWSSGFRPSPDGVLIHFRVPDVAETLAAVVRAGGKVLREKTGIEADCGGYFALFADSEGNRLGLHSDR